MKLDVIFTIILLISYLIYVAFSFCSGSIKNDETLVMILFIFTPLILTLIIFVLIDHFPNAKSKLILYSAIIAVVSSIIRACFN